MDDLSLSSGFGYVWAKAVAGKGRRYQAKKVSSRAQRAMEEYLKTRQELAKPDCPYVFVTSEGTQLKSDSVGSFFKRLNARLPFTIYAHAYRGGGATYASEKGLPDNLIMRQGGWESYEVFKDYTIEASLNSYGELLWGEDEG